MSLPLPIILCEEAPADLDARAFVVDGICPYCSRPIEDHEQIDSDAPP